MSKSLFSPLVLTKLGVFVFGLVPFGLLLYGAFNDRLGANPIETLTHGTGDWALRFLLITLAVTPLRRLSGWTMLQRLRRMLGLFAFFYACLHFLIWFWLDQSLSLSAMVEDVIKRPYITVGFLAFVLLIPLAATSTRGMMRRLGRNWQRLHRLVYAVAVLAVLHFLWLVKADWTEPALYGAILSLLLLSRLSTWPVFGRLAGRGHVA